MVASPGPEYAQMLGETLYQMAGLEWMVIEVIQRLDPATSIEMLAGLTTSGIADQLKSKVDKATVLEPARHDELRAIADDYADLPIVRNDIVHARPATAPDGRQMLYRWAPNKSAFIGFVADELLDRLLVDLRDVSRRLDAARTWLP